MSGEPETPVLAPFAAVDASALDVIDHLLDKGCVVTGRLVLGLARIDLVHVELSLLLTGAERLLRDSLGEAAGDGSASADADAGTGADERVSA